MLTQAHSFLRNRGGLATDFLKSWTGAPRRQPTSAARSRRTSKQRKRLFVHFIVTCTDSRCLSVPLRRQALHARERLRRQHSGPSTSLRAARRRCIKRRSVRRPRRHSRGCFSDRGSRATSFAAMVRDPCLLPFLARMLTRSLADLFSFLDRFPWDFGGLSSLISAVCTSHAADSTCRLWHACDKHRERSINTYVSPSFSLRSRADTRLDHLGLRCHFDWPTGVLSGGRSYDQSRKSDFAVSSPSRH